MLLIQYMKMYIIFCNLIKQNKVKMSRTKPFSFNRSQTKQELPNINLKGQRSGIIRPEKSYLGQISRQISGNVQYDQMNKFSLSKQQRKLKQILRKMNDDTVRIIADYTPRAKKVNNHVRTATTLLAINQKQVQNNNKILSQCQTQIQKLMQRCEGLNAQGKSTYDQFIGKMKQQILICQQQNRNLMAENQKRGKSIMTEQRIIEQGLIQKAQNDVFLAEHKANHLRIDSNRVQQQIRQYEKKLKQVTQKSMQADKYFKQLQKNLKQKDNLKNNQVQYMNKKALLQNTKKKNQFYNQNNQFKYYNLLKKLDSCNISVNETQQKIDKTFVTIQASKMIIGKFEGQLKQMKLKKRQKQQQINEFLSKTRSHQISNSNKEQFNLLSQYKEMPSEIYNKQELQLQNSDIQIKDNIIGQKRENKPQNLLEKQRNKDKQLKEQDKDPSKLNQQEKNIILKLQQEQ